jgi:ABC-type proline/glycine betaine transport system permease subunit
MKDPASPIVSAVITIFLTGCIIIAHDVSKDFRQSLTALTGHHWISVSVIAVILFVLSSGLLLGSKNIRKILRAYDIGLWSTTLIAVTLIMTLGILAVLVAQFLAD